ncbi:MAG: Wzt carbohydrate-binding domain-containing protein, partial [Opitutaceae bacterium]|nr:Wzt carbohydrate-binding domain-containing protein [Cytophagales bacterium]
TLCNSAILLTNGILTSQNTVSEVINKYSETNFIITDFENYIESKCKRFTLKKPYWVDEQEETRTFYTVGEKIKLRFEFDFKEVIPYINPGFAILDMQDQRIFTSHLNDTDLTFDKKLINKITIDTIIEIPLSPGHYKIIYGVRDEFENTVIYKENMLLEIQQTVSKNGANGLLHYTSKWKLQNK